jgi:D-alanyl-D-alanine carboxypeptidase
MKSALLCLIVIIFSNTLISQSLESIDQLGSKLTDIFNSSDKEEALQSLSLITSEKSKADWSTEELYDLLRQLYNDGGKAIYHSAEIDNSNSVVRFIVYRERLGRWENFQFQLDQENGTYKLGSFLFIGASAEPTSIPEGNIESELAWLENYLNKLVSNEMFAGQLLISKNGKPIFKRAFGIGNHSTGHEVTLSDPFNMASGSKMFTAVAAMQLVEKGEIGLQDKLDKYFPEYPDKKFANSATIHHLLSHTSGLGDYWDEEFEKIRNEQLSLEQIYGHIIHDPLVYYPEEGTYGKYSNSGYILLGLIIEKTSGRSFYDYIKDNIFAPAQMNNTNYYRSTEQILNNVLLYSTQPGNDKSNLYIPAARTGRGTSAGGCYSTVEDLLKFQNALLKNKLLSKENTEILLSPKTTLQNGWQYGYGFVIIGEGEDKTIGHGGMAPGVLFNFSYFPNRNYSYFIFSNKESGAYSDLVKAIEKLIKHN